MIEIRQTAITQLEFAGSGTLDRRDVQRAGEALSAALDDGGRATLLLDLRQVEDMTMRALAQDAALAERLMPMLERLQRVALIGDADWLAPLLRLQASTVPSLPLRRFAASEIDTARRWVSHGERATATAEPAAKTAEPPASSAEPTTSRAPQREGSSSFEDVLGALFEAFDTRASGDRPRAAGEASAGLRLEERDGLLVLDLDGRIRREDVERVVALLDAGGVGERAMLARLTRFDGVEPAALLSPALWRLQGEGLSRLSRVALVTSIEWLGRAVESAAARHRIEARSFATGEESAAREWLGEHRASQASTEA